MCLLGLCFVNVLSLLMLIARFQLGTKAYRLATHEHIFYLRLLKRLHHKLSIIFHASIKGKYTMAHTHTHSEYFGSMAKGGWY